MSIREDIIARIEKSKKNSDLFNNEVPKLVTKDGLIKTIHIKKMNNGTFQLSNKEISVVPHWRIYGLFNLIIQKNKLWKQAAFRLSSGSSTVGRAPIFGVPFAEAIKQALIKGEMKSVYYLPKKDPSSGFYSQLFVRINTKKENNNDLFIVEAWEWIGQGEEVIYIHMIISQSSFIVIHLDGAVLEYNSQLDISEIFYSGRKKKSEIYTKYFRLDGEILMDDAFEIIKEFLPIEELTEEYFVSNENWLQFLSQTI